MSKMSVTSNIHPPEMVLEDQESVAMFQQSTNDISQMPEATTEDVTGMSNIETVDYIISEPSPKNHVFTEVTAKVPQFLLDKLGIDDQLPFLVKLAKDVTISIVVGLESEAEKELKSFSYFGTLDSINEIHDRVKQIFHLPNRRDQPEERPPKNHQSKDGICRESMNKVSVGVNTDSVSNKDNITTHKGVMCRLLEEPKYTRSGRQVKTPVLRNLYDYEDYNEDDGNNGNVENSDTEVTDLSKPFDEGEETKSHVEKADDRVRTGHRRRGRPKKIRVEEVGKPEANTEDKQVPEISIQREQLVDGRENEDGMECSEVKKEQGQETGQKSRLIKTSTALGNPLVQDKVQLEEMLQTETNPVQRTRLQKLLYEERTPNKYTCKYCSFTTKRQSHLTKHEQIHEKKHCHVYTCGRCDFKTIRKSKLLLHQDQCSHNVDQGGGEDVGLLCTQCEYKCESHVEMESHWRESHRKLVLPSGKKQLKCYLCDYATNKPKMLNRHMAVHKGSGKHLTELFKCTHEGCEYSTRNKGNFQFHVKGKHSNVKPYLCDTCGTKFKRKHSLKMHLKFVHVASNKKPLPFQCGTCNKLFRSNAHLQEHQVKHTNIRQHLCSICGVAFKTKSAAKRHIHTVHSTSVIRPVCEHCLKPFNSKYTLQRHLQAADGKCGQADRLRTANISEEAGQYQLGDTPVTPVTMEMLKHPFIQKRQVINIVPVEEGYTGEQVLTVEIPAVGQNSVLGEEKVTLMQGNGNLVVLPMDGMVIRQQDATSSGTELSGQQTLLGNETLQGLLNGQLFNVNSGEGQTQLMYINTS